MQTFLPFPDFQLSAAVLDNKRLGKQRVEVLQLSRKQWSNHPASKMWKGHGISLCNYGIAVCDEWIQRGFKDTCRDKIIAEIANQCSDDSYPVWFGDENFHAAHRSNLLRKDFEWYSQFFSGPTDLPYIWPSANQLT